MFCFLMFRLGLSICYGGVARLLELFVLKVTDTLTYGFKAIKATTTSFELLWKSNQLLRNI